MSTNTIPMKKLVPDAKLPSRAHEGDAGLDLFALKDAVLEPRVPMKLQTGIAMAIPYGHVGMICDRSSMGAKGIRVLGGIVDAGYRGEVQVLLINLRDESFRIAAGDKISQMLVLPVNLAAVAETSDLDATARGAGGFGSTGK